MRIRNGIILVVSMVLISIVAVGLDAQSSRAQRARGREQPPPRRTEQAPQQTRVQVDVFQLTCPTEQLVNLDTHKLGADGASAVEVVAQLRELGAVKHLIRIDNSVDITSSSSLTSGKRRPTVKDIAISKSGKMTPSVTYQEVGSIVEMTGRWSETDSGYRADMTTRIEISEVGESGVEVSTGVQLPTFDEIQFRQNILVTSGVPLLFFCNDPPIQKDQKLYTKVTVVRLVATRLPD